MPIASPSNASRPTKRPSPWHRRLPAVLVVVGIYLGLVLVQLRHHEFWRDEVRALSISTRTATLGALFAELRYEGHPSVWYLLLRGAHALVPDPRVLPAVSVTVATLAVLLFVRSACLPWPLRFAFPFGVLPLHEYSVMARNYGVSMLALFAWCLTWPGRGHRPARVGLALVILANTNVHSAIISVALLGCWSWEVWRRRNATRTPGEALSSRQALGIGLGAAGLVACALTVRPLPDLIALGAGTPNTPHAKVERAASALLSPGLLFPHIASLRERITPAEYVTAVPLASVALLVVTFGTWRRGGPLRWAFPGALIGVTLLFALIYPGALRHQGLIVMLALAIAWADAADRAVRGTATSTVPARWQSDPLLGALAALTGLMTIAGAMRFRAELLTDRSAMARVGAWIREHAAYATAGVIAEPAYIVEALPYYARIQLRFPREQRWGWWSRFTREANGRATLQSVLNDAQAAQRTSGRPILIVFDVAEAPSSATGDRIGGYGWRFTWDEEMKARWDAETMPLQRFVGAREENVVLYTLRAPANRTTTSGTERVPQQSVQGP